MSLTSPERHTGHATLHRATVSVLPVPRVGSNSPERPEGYLDSRAVCTAARITYRMLDHWTRAGYTPAAAGPTGSGYARLYTVEQTDRVRHLARLVHAGLPVHTAVDVLTRLDGRSGTLTLTPGVTLTLDPLDP